MEENIDEKLKYKIGMTLIKGVGTLTAKKLVSTLGSEEAVFKTPQKKLAMIPGIGNVLSSEIKNKNSLQRAEKEVAFAQRNGISILFYTDEEYPSRLLNCNDNPIVLYKKGPASLNKGKFLGVVGTRKMTPYGKMMCENIIADLAQRHPDLTIVSGLAYGCDISAHKKAIDCGLNTIAVVGHGLDMLYPQAHLQTARKIMTECGAIVTEYPSGTAIDRNNFVARNRIIAGMSDAVLVIEASAKGGALLTAEFANSYHKDVFAIPGRFGDEFSEGCNNLIKKNLAAMVETAKDIEYQMNWTPEAEKKQMTISFDLNEELDEDSKKVLNILREGSLQINELTRACGLPYNKLSSLLFNLEMDGYVVAAPGNIYSLANNGHK